MFMMMDMYGRSQPAVFPEIIAGIVLSVDMKNMYHYLLPSIKWRRYCFAREIAFGQMNTSMYVQIVHIFIMKRIIRRWKTGISG